MNIVETSAANNLNDADAAYKIVKEHLAKGDYAVLSIANDALGQWAHTVIPYKVEDNQSGYPKKMHIWDPNHPYDADPNHYSDSRKLLVINGPFDWNYTSAGNNYSGAGGGWCFAVPMSLVLTKSRQPMALEVFAEALITLFVSGLGAAVSQISDDEGRRLYTTDADVHTSRLEFETDPQKRLREIVRWPWFGSNKWNKIPGELYFMRRHKNKTSPLNVTVSGTSYKMIECMGRNLLQISSDSKEPARDTIRTYGLISDAISIDIMTSGKKREISIDHLLTGEIGKEWRRYKFKNIKLPERVPIEIKMKKQMNAVAVTSQGKEAQFDLDIEQRRDGRIVTKRITKVTTIPNKILRLAPEDWKNLSKSKLIKDIIEKTD
jgi:hypothetical protein